MSDRNGEEAPNELRVRPYTVTRGRTEAEIELAVETMIQATVNEGCATRQETESRAIIELCREPLSIAEISAHLALPLQVVKVLVGDLVLEGLVATHGGGADASGRPDLALLERVLDGLQSL